MSMRKEELMFQLNLSPEQLKDRVAIAGLKYKEQYCDQEVALIEAIHPPSTPSSAPPEVSGSGAMVRCRKLAVSHQPYAIEQFELEQVDVSQVEAAIAQNQDAYTAFKDFLLKQARAEGEALGEQISIEFQDAIARGRAKGAYEALGKKPSSGSAQ